jgi:hypothetical protein
VRFDFDIDALGDGGGWAVQIREGGTALLKAPRIMRLAGSGPLAFPLPPEPEVARLQQEAPTDAALFALCSSADCTSLTKAYGSILARLPGTGGVERFGRYLFACLLGDKIWSELLNRAGPDEPMELAIGWRDRDRAINRLPWEILRGPKRFLAAEAKIAITRRVAGIDRQIGELKGLPRVLFVVGSELSYDVISPGAEFVGLLRSLQVAGLNTRLRSQLLLNATANKLDAALKWFQPNVVHFICHGGWDADGHSFLRLMHDEKPNEAFEMRAWNLRQSFNGATSLPEMVVLNACFSASSGDLYRDQPGSFDQPLAVEFVKMGVPVVVGMAGEVSDQACRLFTRRFYEALLNGDEFAQAAAEGRRAGIMGKSADDPSSSVDWSLPTLLLADTLTETRLRIPDEVLELEQRLYQAAGAYARNEDYPAFCGRLNFFHWYDMLMADRSVQQTTSRNKREFQMLAVSVNLEDRSKLTPGDRYGRTWLLHEFATQMAGDGHVPVLLSGEKLRKMPNTEDELMKAIMTAALDTAQHFGVDRDWGWEIVPALERIKKNLQPGLDLPKRVASLVAINGAGNREALAEAFRHDLLKLRDAVISRFAGLPQVRGDRTRLVLLLDDIHLYGEAAGFLTQLLLGPSGLRGAPNETRVVGAYSSKPTPEQKTAFDDITRWVANSWVEDLPLSIFTAPEDRLAYKLFLLRYRENNRKSGQPKPLAFATGLNAAEINLCFKGIHRATKGVPSNLKNETVQEYIDEILIEWPTVLNKALLREANDDDDLKTLARKREVAP